MIGYHLILDGVLDRDAYTQGGYSEGYVLDLLALPGRMDVVRRLVDEATLFFRAHAQ